MGHGSELYHWLGTGRSAWDAMRHGARELHPDTGLGPDVRALALPINLFVPNQSYINNLVMGVFIYTKESRVQRAIILYSLFYFIFRKV